MEKVEYRLAKEQDLAALAEIYCRLYTNSALHENWTKETAYKLLKFFYHAHPDIFIVAENNDQAIGAIASMVKPWHDGNHLVETEIFVDTPYQCNGIGSKLYQKHFELAIEKYDAKVIEAYTYEESDGYPLNWYREQGYEIMQNWFVMNGGIAKVYKYLCSKNK